LRKYRVQLNLMRPHNPTTHNMRSFEAAGVGAIQLAPETQDHKMYFQENEEIFLYKDLDSCRKQINKLMELSDKDAVNKRSNARERSIKAGYSYKDRSIHAFKFLEELKSL
jgi:spore maturation protein CgeB